MMIYDIADDFSKMDMADFSRLGLEAEVSYTENLHSMFLSDDPTDKATYITITLYSQWYDDIDRTHLLKLGMASCIRITTFDEVEGSALDFLNVIDSIDQDTFNCLSVFMTKDGQFDDDLVFSQLFYVDRLFIEKKYRGMGLGAILLEYIKLRFSDFITAIVLQPAAFEAKDAGEVVFNAESEHLTEFYMKHGFQHYKDKTWVFHELL